MSEQSDIVKELLGEERQTISDPRYTFEGSALKGSDIAQEAYEGQDAFYGDTAPHKARQREQPIHRLMVHLKSTGMSNKDIAEKVGRSAQCVSEALKQPWARIRLQQEISNAGRDALQGLLASQAEDSIWTLVEMRDLETARPADRITAADKLLDRFLGKPNQPITHSSVSDPDMMSDEDLIKIVKSRDGVTSVST